MQQEIYLGTLPADEELPSDVSTFKICMLWREDLRAHFRHHNSQSNPPTKCKLLVKNQGHELGDYYEVLAVFDDTDEASLKAAYWFEKNAPTKWSVSSRAAFNDIVRYYRSI